MSSSTPIPSFYRIFFTTLDPLLAAGGLLTTWLLPTTFLKSYFPHPVITPETRFTLDANAGFFASDIVLQVFLLRARPTDVGVWKAVQAAVVLQDFAFLAGFVRAAGEQGRLSPSAWTGMEWSNLGVLAAVATIRVAFIAGVGLKRGKSKGS